MKEYHIWQYIVIFSRTSLHTSPSVNTTLLALLEISWERKNISWERTTLHKFPEKSPSCFKNLFFSYVSKATTVPRVMITIAELSLQKVSFSYKRSTETEFYLPDVLHKDRKQWQCAKNAKWKYFFPARTWKGRRWGCAANVSCGGRRGAADKEYRG